MVLPVVERGAPPGPFEGATISGFEHPTVAAGAGGGTAQWSGHDAQCEPSTLWNVSPDNL